MKNPLTQKELRGFERDMIKQFRAEYRRALRIEALPHKNDLFKEPSFFLAKIVLRRVAEDYRLFGDEAIEMEKTYRRS